MQLSEWLRVLYQMGIDPAHCYNVTINVSRRPSDTVDYVMTFTMEHVGSIPVTRCNGHLYEVIVRANNIRSPIIDDESMWSRVSIRRV